MPDDKRQRFVLEYLKDLNATQAAIRAGYSKRTAKQQGSRLLACADIAEAVARRVAKATEQGEITVERTLKEIARIAYGDPRKLYDDAGNLRPIQTLDEDTAAQIAGIETEELARVGKDPKDEKRLLYLVRKVKRWDKIRALEQCMSYLGLHKTQAPNSGGSLTLHIHLSTGKRVA